MHSERKLDVRFLTGIAIALVGVAAIGLGVTAGVRATDIDLIVVPLHNDRAELNEDCPRVDDPLWHFVIAPGNAQFAIHTISLVLNGTLFTFEAGNILLNAGQRDNVFVRVPAGHVHNDLQHDGSFAEVTPTLEEHTTNFRLVLSGICLKTTPPNATTTAPQTTTGGHQTTTPTSTTDLPTTTSAPTYTTSTTTTTNPTTPPNTTTTTTTPPRTTTTTTPNPTTTTTATTTTTTTTTPPRTTTTTTPNPTTTTTATTTSSTTTTTTTDMNSSTTSPTPPTIPTTSTHQQSTSTSVAQQPPPATTTSTTTAQQPPSNPSTTSPNATTLPVTGSSGAKGLILLGSISVLLGLGLLLGPRLDDEFEDWPSTN